MLAAINGVELSCVDVNDPFGRQYALQFFFCEHHKQVVTVTSGPRPAPKDEPAKDLEYAVLPYYMQTLSHRPGNGPSGMGYLARKAMVGQNRGQLESASGPGRRGPPQVSYHRVEIIEHGLEKDVALILTFLASQWPGNEEQVRDMLKEAIGQFVAQMTTEPRF